MVAQEPTIPNLFNPVPVNEITRYHDTDGAVRQDNVTMNYELFLGEEAIQAGADQVNINLFEDVSFVGTHVSTELVYAGGRTVQYSIGDNGWDYA